MAGELSDKIAVVTGSGKGIGRATAKLFVEEGATVVAVARTQKDLESLVQETQGFAGEVISYPGDLTDGSVVERLFADVASRFERLDILINNAGVAPFGSISDMNPDTFRDCLMLNIWAVFLCTQQAVNMMKKEGRGKIINIGSVRSHWTEGGGAGAYNASKYGVRGFTESVARELHGQELNISVGMVCPGIVNTTLTNPKGEARDDWLRPETVARAVLHAVTAPDDVNVFDTILFSTFQKPW